MAKVLDIIIYSRGIIPLPGPTVNPSVLEYAIYFAFHDFILVERWVVIGEDAKLNDQRRAIHFADGYTTTVHG